MSDYLILNADRPDSGFRPFTPRTSPHEYSIEHFGDKFYVLTNWNAENFRLMETPENETGRENWKEVIPHRADVFPDGIEVFRDYLVVRERFDALTHLNIIKKDTFNDLVLRSTLLKLQCFHRIG